MVSVLLALVLSHVSSPAQAAYVTNIPAVGPHYTVLEVDKNENPQNIMEIYTKLDANCLIELSSPNSPVFGFYWLMNRTKYKPVNGTIVSAIRSRFPVDTTSIKQTSFETDFNDLSQLNDDIPEHQILIEAEKTASGCDVGAYITLGPSDGGATIRLTSIYSEAHFSITSPPAFQKLDAVTLRGIDTKTGKQISHRYPAK